MLNIITKGSIGCYETLGVSYAEQNLQLSGPKTGAGAASARRAAARHGGSVFFEVRFRRREPHGCVLLTEIYKMSHRTYC